MLTIENTDSDLKVHALHYANELLVRVRLSFQKLLQNRSTYKNNTKKIWEKSNDVYSLSIRVQTTTNHVSIFTFLCFFYDNINIRKKMFSFRARAEKGIRELTKAQQWRRGQRRLTNIFMFYLPISRYCKVINIVYYCQNYCKTKSGTQR